MRYADRFFFDNNGSAIELLTEMNAAIHNLSSSIQIYSSMDFRNNRSFAASDDLDAVSESLSELLDRIDDMLIWIEQHGSNTELVYCPKNTKEIVSRLYFNGDERTILTSATLTSATSGSLEEQYSYFGLLSSSPSFTIILLNSSSSCTDFTVPLWSMNLSSTALLSVFSLPV